MKVVVMRGISGSGKSTYVRENFRQAAVFSADQFFTKEGVYQFNPGQLALAHGTCLQRFVWALDDAVAPVLVVDNTNTTAVEVAPYAAITLAWGYELEVVTLQCDPEVAAARNVHGVSREAVLAMHRRLTEAVFPPWWPHRVVKVAP